MHCAIDRNGDRDVADNTNGGGASDDADFWYLTNRLGSIMAIVEIGEIAEDVEARVLEYYKYNVYGQVDVLPIVDVSPADGIEDTPFDLSDNHAAMITTRSSDPPDPTAGRVSRFGNEYFFTARRLDTNTGLYYYRHRYYSWLMGRFVGRDPIGYADGLNLYAYTLNSPSVFIDSLGLDSQENREFRAFREFVRKGGVFGDWNKTRAAFHQMYPEQIELIARIWKQNIEGQTVDDDTLNFTKRASWLAEELSKSRPDRQDLMAHFDYVTATVVTRHSNDLDHFRWFAFYGPNHTRVYGDVSTNSRIADIAVENARGNYYSTANCVQILNISGHGVRGGVSVVESTCEFSINGLTENDLRRIANSLCKNATINFCSCESTKINCAVTSNGQLSGNRTGTQMQMLADKLGARICGCTGCVSGVCNCHGTWRCYYPHDWQRDSGYR